MSVKQAAETAAQTTIPIPLGISGLTFLGVTVKDWVLLGTAVLIVFQLIVIAPKAYRVIRQGHLQLKLLGDKLYGKGSNRSP